jgi:hypothetical protein
VNPNTDYHPATLALFQETYPHLPPPPERPGNLFTYLATLPAVRIPVATHRFNDVKPQNIPAFFMQAAGDVVPWEKANCWYARQGSTCTFRQGMTTAPQRRITGGTPTPAAQPKRPDAPTSVPAPAAPTPIHPSYAAALATGAVAAAPAPTATAPTNSSATSSNFSPGTKARVWETRYGSMDIDSLLRAHEHLEEWQEDLTTRLMAMNRVVLAKLMERGS